MSPCVTSTLTNVPVAHDAMCSAAASRHHECWLLVWLWQQAGWRLSQSHTRDRFHCSTEAKGHGQPGLVLNFVPSVQVSVVAVIEYVDNEKL